MFCRNIVLLCISFAGALCWYFVKTGKNFKSSLFFYLIPIAGIIVNLLFTHKGATVLFMINNNAVTLESAFYGFVSGLMISGVIMWFSSFSNIMTTDKLLYVFGKMSPKLALILSMTLRYIPLYKKQIEKTNQAQKALGLYKDDAAVDKLKGGMRIFSVMVTWALENGVITADSMTARGYGVGKRSFFSVYSWSKDDKLLALLSLLLCAFTMVPLVMGRYSYTFYPRIISPSPGTAGYIGYAAYLILSFIPEFMQIKEELSWKSLQSKI